MKINLTINKKMILKFRTKIIIKIMKIKMKINKIFNKIRFYNSKMIMMKKIQQNKKIFIYLLIEIDIL